MFRHYWLATEAKTGRVMSDVPLMRVPKCKKTIGQYEPATGSFPLVGRGVPEDWERILTAGATNFHLMRDNPADPAHGIPLWGGMLVDAPKTEADSIDLSMQTLEWYFDGRYVGDETYTNIGQNLIVKDLVETYAAAGPNGGIPIRVQIVNGGNGKIRNRKYLNTEDKTLYSVLRDLMGVIDGPEWTIGWEWQSDPERITPVLYVGDRIGTAKSAAFPSPAAVFEMPGSVKKFTETRSFARGRGANAVMAKSSGQGGERPESQPVVTSDPLRPTFEHRFTPSTSIKDTSTLDDHAASKSAILSVGSPTLELVAFADRGPLLDKDWFIGDDIGYSIGMNSRARLAQAPVLLDSEGYVEEPVDEIEDEWEIDGEGYYEPPKDGRPIVPAYPRGREGVARAIGWELSPEGTPEVTPILADDE